MSNGFSNIKVGLSQLYAQLRTKTIPNAANEAGATLRSTTIPNPAAPPAPATLDVAIVRNGGAETVPVPNTILVNAIVDNGGELDQDTTPVTVLVLSDGPETVDAFVLAPTNSGTLVGEVGTGTTSAQFVVLPGPGGLIRFGIELSAGAKPRVTVLAGRDMVSTDITIT